MCPCGGVRRRRRECGVGSLASTTILDTTEAYVGHAVRSRDIEPSSVCGRRDDTSIFDFSGTVAVGGSNGVAAGVDANVLIKNTYAWIGRDNATETLIPADAANVYVVGGDVTVAAESSENIFSLVIGLAVGGDAGLAGTVAVYT